MDHEIEARPAVERGSPGEEPAHEGHRAAAEQDPGPFLAVAFGAHSDGGLQLGREGWGVPYQVGKLIDHHGQRSVPRQPEEQLQRLFPVDRRRRDGGTGEACDGVTQEVQGLGGRCLDRRVVEAVGGVRQRLKKETLALPTAAGHHAEPRTRALGGCEGGQLAPLPLSVEHVQGSRQIARCGAGHDAPVFRDVPLRSTPVKTRRLGIRYAVRTREASLTISVTVRVWRDGQRVRLAITDPDPRALSVLVAAAGAGRSPAEVWRCWTRWPCGGAWSRRPVVRRCGARCSATPGRHRRGHPGTPERPGRREPSAGALGHSSARS